MFLGRKYQVPSTKYQVSSQSDSYLPGAKVEFSVWEWHCQVGAQEAGLHVGRLQQ